MLKAPLFGLCIFFGAQAFGQHLPEDSTETAVGQQPIELFAPNVFTPNGNTRNETWKIYISGADEYSFHLILFNRNGEIVWESFNPAGEWDGYYGSQAASPGLYPWVIQTKVFNSDKIEQFTGHILLLQ